jgi:hypothetical protein
MIAKESMVNMDLEFDRDFDEEMPGSDDDEMKGNSLSKNYTSQR